METKRKKNQDKIALHVHAMPKTSEKNFKQWFVLSILIFVLILALLWLIIN